MKSLVTGGAGFIGSHLVEHLTSKNEKVLVLDDFSSSNEQSLEKISKNKSVEVVNGSVLDQKMVAMLMSSVTKCFHLAASVGVERINKEPLKSFEVNTRGSEIVLNEALKFNVRTLLASSSEVYGRNPKMPLTEESDRVLGSPKVARWSYSEAKAIDEFYAFELYEKNSLKVTIARLFNTIGIRQSSNYGMVLPKFIKAALDNQPLIVYGDGNQSRAFCAVTDVVVAFYDLMNTPESIGQVYNIGSSNEISIKELAVKVVELTSSKSKIVLKRYNEVFADNFEEPFRRVPDISKLSKAISWKPRKSLDEVILEIAQSMKANAV
jgi:UDP-glucose 4-epimerase